jgi:hypothetical protein
MTMFKLQSLYSVEGKEKMNMENGRIKILMETGVA